MNENNEALYMIGPLMKAARKFKKYNQADVARAIGCSQSALSKMEHNLLIPSAPQWFLFSRFTTIPPESLEIGIIDRHTMVKFNNEDVSMGFKLPKKYRMNRAAKVREIYPFLKYLGAKDPEGLKNFVDSSGIDSEFFLDFDNLVSFQLDVDIIKLFIQMGKNSEKDIQEIIAIGQDKIYWDDYEIDWQKFKEPKEILLQYANDQLFFQTDFQLRLEQQGNQLIVSFTPEYHLKQMKDVGEDVTHFLNIYRRLTLNSVVQKALNTSVSFEVLIDESHTPLTGRFVLRGP